MPDSFDVCMYPEGPFAILRMISNDMGRTWASSRTLDKKVVSIGYEP